VALKIVARKQKKRDSDPSAELWIAPGFSLKGRNGDRGMDRGGNLTPNNATRLLELADVALGLKKSTSKKRHPVRDPQIIKPKTT
jgi:hypothetical protein